MQRTISAPAARREGDRVDGVGLGVERDAAAETVARATRGDAGGSSVGLDVERDGVSAGARDLLEMV